MLGRSVSQRIHGRNRAPQGHLLVCQVHSLIRSSEPNVTLWIRSSGQLKGVYDGLAETEQALEMLCGKSINETEDERLATVGVTE